VVGVDEVEAGLVERGLDDGGGGGAREEVDLAGEVVRVGVDLGARAGHDALRHGDEVGVEERGEHLRECAREVSDLLVAGVEDGDGVAVVRVERLADQADGLAAGDLAVVVAHSDDLGDEEAQEVGLVVVGGGGGGGAAGGGGRHGR